MIHDIRQKTLADNLVNYSCGVKSGDKVWIDVSGAGAEFTSLLVKAVYAAGGMPFVFTSESKVKRELLAEPRVLRFQPRHAGFKLPSVRSARFHRSPPPSAPSSRDARVYAQACVL